MARAIKNTYIDFELSWLEERAKEQRDFVDAHPLSDLEDRVRMREVKGGGLIPVTVSTIEQQHKNIRDTLKDYAALIEVISKLREVEEKKKKDVRGGADLSPFEDGTI